MKKSELKQIIKEVIKENQFARNNPDSTWSPGVPQSGWNNPTKVKELKDLLMKQLNAGNFDAAKRTVDVLANYFE